MNVILRHRHICPAVTTQRSLPKRGPEQRRRKNFLLDQGGTPRRRQFQQPLGTLLTQRIPRSQSEVVSQVFDDVTQVLPVLGQRAGRTIQQFAVLQTLDGLVPLFLRPSAASLRELALKPDSRRGVRDQRVQAVQSRGLKSRNVAVAAILTQQCQRVPETQVRFGRPVERRPTRIQGAGRPLRGCF